ACCASKNRIVRLSKQRDRQEPGLCRLLKVLFKKFFTFVIVGKYRKEWFLGAWGKRKPTNRMA
ncbi:hypothetical protein, partial [Paenibacillus agaridevorans]|uniref:hypothetical protein n=1 Tax=Paenibacillus agaridevorans TaxID=171404 RepID=UPI001C6282B0